MSICNRSLPDHFDKPLEAPVIGALYLRREAARRKFPSREMVCDALAADAFPRTARIGAGAFPEV
jgi:hypothetical protein